MALPIKSFTDSKTPLPQVLPHNSRVDAPLRILIVEDNPDLAANLVDYLDAALVK